MGGAIEFPHIPGYMFFGFDLFETNSLISMLRWTWENSGTTSPMPADYMPHGFGDGEERALHALSWVLAGGTAEGGAILI